MKKLNLILILILISASSTTSQEKMQDVLYLKDGSIVKGTIVEQNLNVSVKIRLSDGITYIYPMDDVKKITQEPVPIIVAPEEPAEKLPYKSPELAFALSFIFPGAGQFYNGEAGKGATQLALVGCGIAMIAYDSNKKVRYYGDGRNEVFRIAGVLMLTGGFVWSVIDAPLSAIQKNKKWERENIYGHFMEFDSGNQIVGFDLGYRDKILGGKVTLHF